MNAFAQNAGLPRIHNDAMLFALTSCFQSVVSEETSEMTIPTSTGKSLENR